MLIQSAEGEPEPNRLPVMRNFKRVRLHYALGMLDGLVIGVFLSLAMDSASKTRNFQIALLLFFCFTAFLSWRSSRREIAELKKDLVSVNSNE